MENWKWGVRSEKLEVIEITSQKQPWVAFFFLPCKSKKREIRRDKNNAKKGLTNGGKLSYNEDV